MYQAQKTCTTNYNPISQNFYFFTGKHVSNPTPTPSNKAYIV